MEVCIPQIYGGEPLPTLYRLQDLTCIQHLEPTPHPGSQGETPVLVQLECTLLPNILWQRCLCQLNLPL